jgi:hypothetical protein
MEENLAAESPPKKRRFAQGFRVAEPSVIFERVTKPFVNPDFISKKFTGVTRASQWTAAFILPLLIIATFPIVVAIDAVINQVILNGDDLGNQLTIASFMATGIGIGLFLFAVWLWFFWVKTGGFGLFAY